MESVVDKWLEKIMAEAKAEESAYVRAVRGIMNRLDMPFDEAADIAQVPLNQRPAIRTRMGL